MQLVACVGVNDEKATRLGKTSSGASTSPSPSFGFWGGQSVRSCHSTMLSSEVDFLLLWNDTFSNYMPLTRPSACHWSVLGRQLRTRQISGQRMKEHCKVYAYKKATPQSGGSSPVSVTCSDWIGQRMPKELSRPKWVLTLVKASRRWPTKAGNPRCHWCPGQLRWTRKWGGNILDFLGDSRYHRSRYPSPYLSVLGLVNGCQLNSARLFLAKCHPILKALCACAPFWRHWNLE